MIQPVCNLFLITSFRFSSIKWHPAISLEKLISIPVLPLCCLIKIHNEKIILYRRGGMRNAYTVLVGKPEGKSPWKTHT
jgi:hypothetical protein